jgi:cellulose biosynthesis protein BcsQ
MWVIVPFSAEPTSERRGRHVLEGIEALSVTPRVFMLATSVDARRVLTASVIEQAQESGIQILGSIPRAVAVPESTNVGKSILAYDPVLPASKAYRDAADALRTILR